MITVWKEGQELEPGKLVLCQNQYWIFEKFEQDACILDYPYKDVKIRTSFDLISIPSIIPWAEEVADFINRHHPKNYVPEAQAVVMEPQELEEEE